MNPLIVFTPKDNQQYVNKRFLISINQLSKYIGSQNVSVVLSRFGRCNQDKCTIKLRKFGKIEIYQK